MRRYRVKRVVTLAIAHVRETYVNMYMSHSVVLKQWPWPALVSAFHALHKHISTASTCTAMQAFSTGGMRMYRSRQKLSRRPKIVIIFRKPQPFRSCFVINF